MEHKTLEQIRQVADVRTHKPLSRRERLERWAEALERLNGARVRSLVRTEYVPREERDLMRIDNSPLSVAFEDPVLRAEGLIERQARRFDNVLRPLRVRDALHRLLLPLRRDDVVRGSGPAHPCHGPSRRRHDAGGCACIRHARLHRRGCRGGDLGHLTAEGAKRPGRPAARHGRQTSPPAAGVTMNFALTPGGPDRSCCGAGVSAFSCSQSALRQAFSLARASAASRSAVIVMRVVTRFWIGAQLDHRRLVGLDRALERRRQLVGARHELRHGSRGLRPSSTKSGLTRSVPTTRVGWSRS